MIAYHNDYGKLKFRGFKPKRKTSINRIILCLPTKILNPKNDHNFDNNFRNTKIWLNPFVTQQYDAC
jgi:hypothetical protein